MDMVTRLAVFNAKVVDRNLILIQRNTKNHHLPSIHKTLLAIPHFSTFPPLICEGAILKFCKIVATLTGVLAINFQTLQ